jgi:hypothetical protein
LGIGPIPNPPSPKPNPPIFIKNLFYLFKFFHDFI